MQRPGTSEHSTPRGAVAYSRVSTDEQRERATIETQHVEINRYCARHEITLAGRYVDEGWSGRKKSLRQRPDGARLLVDASTGEFNTVIVYRVDRLGRGRKLIAALDEMQEAGVRYIISVTEATYDLRNSNDEFHLTMLSGVSGYEANGFLQRSKDATNRLAREGQWLGGIVPYGYRVEGVDREARLAVADDTPLPVCNLTEAEVIRRIYRRIVDDDWSTQRIADELNMLGVPPAYVRDGRHAKVRGKRVQAVQGVWRAGRVRNMLVNTTYKGLHEYGKRSPNDEREIIPRAVPAIVDEATWDTAQERLRSHMIFSRKNAKREYLLRGLITCGCCGLRYCGTGWKVSKDGTAKTFYRCTASAQYRGLYGKRLERCPSKAIDGEQLEAAIWADIEQFIRDPGPVLDELARQMEGGEQQLDRLRDEIADLKLHTGMKEAERDNVVSLWRRGRIDSAALDRQLDAIQVEEADLREQLAEREAALVQYREVGEGLRSAEALLRELHARLDAPDAPVTPDLKRQVIGTLVAGITVDTLTDEATGKRRTEALVRYRFRAPAAGTPEGTLVTAAATRAGKDSWRRSA